MANHIVDVVYEFTVYKASRDFYEKHKKELDNIETGGELTDFLLKNAENPSDVNYYDYYLENLYDYFEELTRFNKIPFRGRLNECVAKVYFGQNEDKYVIKKCVTFIFDTKDIEDIENVEDVFIVCLILEMTVVEVEFSKILGKRKLFLSQRILNLL